MNSYFLMWLNPTTIDLGFKDKLLGTKKSVKEQLEYQKKGSLYQKKILETDQIVHIKTDATAILVRRKGNETAFFKEFDKITREGYQLILHEEINDPIPGLNIKLAYVFYFQHIKFLK